MKKIILLLAIAININSNAQGLLDGLDDKVSGSGDKLFKTATFKTSRLINGHTIEQTGEGILDFKINHRFGTLNKGGYELWGLDNATMRMGFDYGIKNWLTIGIGRSTYEKTYDGFAKASIIRQATGHNAMPFTLVYLTGFTYKTLKGNAVLAQYPANRTSYFHQALIASKITPSLSLQLMPTLVHQNMVPLEKDPNDLVSIGAGGRIKVSRRVSINTEYYYQVPGLKLDGTTNTFSLGCDIETGGHVFQLHVTNSRGMIEPSFINNNTGTWSNGDILFGFNISRVFTVKKPTTW